MRRRLTRPQNPEVLGRLFAALRVYSGQRKPKNATERKVNDALKKQKVPQGVAKRMIRTLDAMPKGARTKLLGKVAAPNFAPPARAEMPTTRPVTVTVPAGAVRHLGRALGDVRLDVEDRLGEGPRAEYVYTINYRGLWCEQETVPYGFWGPGSDEIYAITSAVHIDDAGANIVRTERHPVAQGETWYEDVDSDEARIGPVAACWQGNSDPISLTVVVFEHDKGDPDAYREEVDSLVKAAIAVLTYFYPPAAVLALLSDNITDGINWLLDTGDDVIETQTVVNPRGLLDWYAGQYRSTYSGGLEYHFITTHRGEGATYILGFEVTRDPPVKMPEGPFL